MVDGAAKDSDRAGAQGGRMGLAVNAEREAGYGDKARFPDAGCDIAGQFTTRCGRVPGADDGDRGLCGEARAAEEGEDGWGWGKGAEEGWAGLAPDSCLRFDLRRAEARLGAFEETGEVGAVGEEYKEGKQGQASEDDRVPLAEQPGAGRHQHGSGQGCQ